MCKAVGVVGLRFKGSNGSLENCFDDDGNRSCEKLSMKIKFNEVDKDLRFFGMKKLNFHSMIKDKSKMAERISYKAFRDAGIVAPRSSWARLEVNDEELGLFALVEQIDGRFTDDRFVEGDGDLYKSSWPDNSDPSSYESETNEDEATHDRISRFAGAMLSAAPEDRLEMLGQWTSLSQMYTYMAVQDAVAQWDGVTAWYCKDGDIARCSNHNFYWYSQETTDHFTIIPWDMDRTMVLETPFTNKNVPHWTESDFDCDSLIPPWTGKLVLSPGCDPILSALASNMDMYAKAVDEILDGASNIRKIAGEIKSYREFIGSEIGRDRYGGYSGAGGFFGESFARRWHWRKEVDFLLKELPLLKRQLEGYRDNGQSSGPPGVIDTMQLLIYSIVNGIWPSLSWWI